MARLRKTARLWQSPKAREEAGRAWLESDPRLFAIDPPAIFGRHAPLEIEIGAGKGEFIIARAREFPGRNFLAVELSAAVARLLAVRCGRAGLKNLRVARMDARTLVNLMLPEASVAAFHVYFPDPWPKERHSKHRLFTPDFAAAVARALVPGGAMSIATDVAGYAAAIFPMMEAAGLVRIAADAPGAALTGFARKYAAAGKKIYAASFRRLP